MRTIPALGRILLGLILLIIVAGIVDELSKSGGKSGEQASTRTLDTLPVELGMTPSQLDAASRRIRADTDKVEGIVWFRYVNSPRYVNSRTSISLYFGMAISDSAHAPESPPWLNLSLQYVSSDWLFIKSYIIKADERVFYLTPLYGDVKRDNGRLAGGDVGIWEWYDRQVTSLNFDVVLAIINSKKATIRFEGTNYRKDYAIPAQEKAAMKDVLAVWKKMGGVITRPHVRVL